MRSERGWQAPRLPPEAITLLFEVLEGPRTELSAAAARLALGGATLLASGLLIRSGDEAVTAAVDDHSDGLVSVFAVGDEGQSSYYSPSAGVVRIAPEQLTTHRVDVARVLALLTRDLGLPRISQPRELMEGLVWELGAARLPRRRARATVWFARRPWDQRVGDALLEAVRRRLRQDTAILLTSAPARRVTSLSVPGFLIVPVSDALGAPDTLVVDPEILAARLGAPQGGSTPSPVELSADGRLLTINGSIEFRFNAGEAQAAICKLVDAYRDGGRRLPIGELTTHGSMGRLFGPRWAQLKPFITNMGGRWGFDV